MIVTKVHATELGKCYRSWNPIPKKLRLTYLYSLIRKASSSHQKPLSLVLPPAQDAAFPHVWTIGQQHWKDTLYVRIHIQNSHLHYLRPYHHHHILILLSDLGASRSQTASERHHLLRGLLSSPVYWPVAVSCVLGRSEQGPQSRVWSASQKRPLASWCVTQICSSELWSWVSPGLSGKGSQPLEDNIGCELGLCWYSPALRAALWNPVFLPAKAQTGTAVVPTVYGDGVQEAVHADGAAGEFILEGF